MNVLDHLFYSENWSTYSHKINILLLHKYNDFIVPLSKYNYKWYGGCL